ncbi:hypothetical protein [Parerythrobacter lacustris]|uniref:Uncharacterized protein n=1 Tax=Parerythrobacter lacustris TaxID=2969984 RepID=A0ABT1XL95_9SPHN|nr:hypothetical protein [Parerythrobacter lacustris]MCR2832436.1 hypothetical protein [Parerythrobacter lacustris]
MARTALSIWNNEAQALEVLRSALVLGCGLALALAGTIRPF